MVFEFFDADGDSPLVEAASKVTFEGDLHDLREGVQHGPGPEQNEEDREELGPGVEVRQLSEADRAHGCDRLIQRVNEAEVRQQHVTDGAGADDPEKQQEDDLQSQWEDGRDRAAMHFAAIIELPGRMPPG